MGYPADRYEGVYRNNIEDVSRFLSLKHGNKFYVYNLCVEKERQYNSTRFKNQVCSDFTFEDHNPPPLKMILSFCQHAESQLKDQQDRTLVIHCKAGKGRTGVMSCCFLLNYYRMEYNDPLDTLRYYAQQRTSNEKVCVLCSTSEILLKVTHFPSLFQGVTIPSQRRYVEYFGHLLNTGVSYSTKQICFSGLLITYDYNQVLHTIKSADHKIQYQSFDIPVERDLTSRRDTACLSYNIWDLSKRYFMPPLNQQCQIPLEDDVLIELYTKNKRGKLEKLCHFWFNTFFLVEPQMQKILTATDKKPESNLGTLTSCLINDAGHKHVYTLIKKDIDRLHKDKYRRETPDTFSISVLFDLIPKSTSISQSSTIINSDLPLSLEEEKIDTKIKLMETNDGSSLIITPTKSLNMPNKEKQQSRINTNNTNESVKTKTTTIRRRSTDPLPESDNDENEIKLRIPSKLSNNRQFNLYRNGISDWDSSDSTDDTSSSPKRQDFNNNHNNS
ncbi:unnamed protein product [Didymodactylos carnosus]|uniref:Phosphatidylinositol 3,4,5-trisphosphate 3-phosphatase and dual-specificity protein phosphatase PTEN n=1 Tax=Didymodactylos carnosus TaxID=1234261 RepID=A0A813S438_9BILA|nr:unnamed protein product [Didymodactylos carnosus]CAF1160038.1 unnamed protein product [Didymodactylos carnosus]CAF3574789.1 unnamed protein product [Didymodactylos carnosus]CAF3971674.1 unnamed protein product [Didymodactylos carnosus]